MRYFLSLLGLLVSLTASAQTSYFPFLGPIDRHPALQNSANQRGGGADVPVPVLSNGAKPRTIKQYNLQVGGTWNLIETTQFTYNAALLPEKRVSIRSATSADSGTYTYNDRGWLTREVTFSDTTDITYTFNANNQLTSILLIDRYRNSSYKDLNEFVYNTSTGKIDTIKGSSEDRYMTSINSSASKIALGHDAQGNLSSFALYVHDSLNIWHLEQRLNNVILSNNATDLTADFYIPSTPYSLEEKGFNFIGGQGVNRNGSSQSYDSIRATGTSTANEYTSIQQKRFNNDWIPTRFEYRNRNADLFLLSLKQISYSNAGAITYQGVKNNTYTYNGNDLLEYISYDSSYGSSSTNKYVFSDFVTATTPQKAATLHAYPNPVQGVLTVTGCLPKAQATVQNAQGKTVWVGVLADTQGTATLSTDGWPAGLYLLQTEGRVLRFVKE